MASKMIGLDLGAREVRVCEVKVGFSGEELVGAYSAPVVPEADEPLIRAQLRAAVALLERHELSHEPLALGVPRGLTSTNLLEFPFKQTAKIAEVLPFELEELLPFDIDDLFYADMSVRDLGDQGLERLVAYALDEDFELFFDELNAAGLNPKLLTLSGLAMGSLSRSEQLQGAEVLLDIGELGSEWLICSQGSIRRIHRMNIGGEAVTRALAEAFKVELEPAEQGKLREASLFSRGDISQLRSESARTRAEAIHRAVEGALGPMIQELKRTLAAYERETGDELKLLSLVGGSAELGGLSAYLSSHLDLHVELAVAPAELASLRPEEARGPMRFHTAYGLGEALAQRRDRELINFRRERYAYQGDADAMKSAILWTAVCLLISLSFYGLQVVYELDELVAEVESLEGEVKELSTQLMGNDAFDLDALKARVNSKKGVSAEVPEVSALDTLGELSAKIPKDTEVEFDIFNVTMPPGGRGRLELRGKTQTVGDVGVIISALEEGDCFTKVKKDSVSKSVDGRTSFRLTASASCRK